MSRRKCVIFGTSKIADVLYQTIIGDNDSDLDPVAFCVDKEYLIADKKVGLPVVGFDDVQDIYDPDQYDMIIAIGYHDLNRVREKKCAEAIQKGYQLKGYIHSKADVALDMTCGKNTIILSNVSIGPGSQIGNNTVIFSGAIISHHVIIGNNNWITSGTVIGGNTIIGNNCFLGISSSIGHNTGIGNYNFLGTNAVVTKKTEDNSVYIVSDTPKYRLNSEDFLKLFKFN